LAGFDKILVLLFLGLAAKRAFTFLVSVRFAFVEADFLRLETPTALLEAPLKTAKHRVEAFPFLTLDFYRQKTSTPFLIG
jgi:hypothetical protein